MVIIFSKDEGRMGRRVRQVWLWLGLGNKGCKVMESIVVMMESIVVMMGRIVVMGHIVAMMGRIVVVMKEHIVVARMGHIVAKKGHTLANMVQYCEHTNTPALTPVHLLSFSFPNTSVSSSPPVHMQSLVVYKSHQQGPTSLLIQQNVYAHPCSSSTRI